MYKLAKSLHPLIYPVPARPVTIPGFEHYLISFWGGVVFNTRTFKVAKGWFNLQRYKRVQLVNKGLKSNQYIHRLVCMAWKKNPLNKSDVNHLDRIRDSNSAPNLEWLTHAENMTYVKCEPLVEQYEIAPF